jgi:hypothetical protein
MVRIGDINGRCLIFHGSVVVTSTVINKHYGIIILIKISESVMRMLFLVDKVGLG